MTTLYRPGEQVRGLIPIGLTNRPEKCPLGYLYTVEFERPDGTLLIVRNECGGRRDWAIVSPGAVEPAYIVVDGTSYDRRMANECINALEFCRRNNWLVHLHHGYARKEGRHVPKDGEPKPVGLDWLEEHGCRGYVGRSMGPTKVALIVPRKCDGGDGFGGGSIGGCIVKIRKLKSNGTTDKVLWQHPQYRLSPISIHVVDETHNGKRYCLEVKVDGSQQALFRNWSECRKWCNLFEVAPRITETQEVPCLAQ